VLSAAHAERVVGLVNRLDTLDDVREIMDIVRT
jgi:hypothetical protein